MSSLTDLKEKKTLFTMCSCMGELLVIEYDEEFDVADLSVYQHRNSFLHIQSFWQKLRYCWQILWHSKPYTDQMQLSKEQLVELKKFIESL